MAALTDIRAGIAANLSTLPGLQTSPHALANPTPPCAQVAADDPLINYDETMQRGIDTYRLLVELFVALVTDKGAQIKLDEYLDSAGASSIKAAIESDRSLGGAAMDLHVTHIDGYGPHDLGDRRALGCRVHVEVTASGTT